jgi:hypothetical protein
MSVGTRCCFANEACVPRKPVGVIGRVRSVRRRLGSLSASAHLVPALLTPCVCLSRSALFGPIDSACCVRANEQEAERAQIENKQEPPLLLPHHNIYRPLFGVEFLPPLFIDAPYKDQCSPNVCFIVAGRWNTASTWRI